MKKIIFILFFSLVTGHLFSQQWNRLNNGGISGGGIIMDLGIYKDSLYISGGFSSAGGLSTQNLACYDSLSWTSFNPGIIGGLDDMINYQGLFFVSGNVLNIGGITTADEIGTWNGSSWGTVSNGDNDGNPHDMVIYNSELIVIGPTQMNSITNLNFVAKWDGSNWSGVGGGVTGGTTDGWSGCVYQNELYVGGRFFFAGTTAATNIAKWNGTQWYNVGDANAEVKYMMTDTINDVLYAIGYFNVIGGTSAAGIAKYDGENWYPVGGGLDACGGWALEIYQNQLYAGGCFLQADGDTTIKYVARFDGQNWQSLTTGVNVGIYDLQVYKNELYVGGGFTTAGDTVVTALARWSYPLDSACATMYADILPLPDTLYLADAPFTFKSGCYGNSSLQWNFSDGFTSTAGQPTYNFNNLPGTYTINLIAQCGTNSDTATTTVVVINNVGIDELNKENIEMIIYPNPASEEITIKFNKQLPVETKLEITDITGKIIYSKMIQSENEKINTSGWQRGNYFASMIYKNKRITQKSFILK